MLNLLEYHSNRLILAGHEIQMEDFCRTLATQGTLDSRLHSFLADRLTPFKPGWQMMPTIKAVSTLFWDNATALSQELLPSSSCLSPWIKAIGVTFKQI